jgi:hypothetical protein
VSRGRRGSSGSRACPLNARAINRGDPKPIRKEDWSSERLETEQTWIIKAVDLKEVSVRDEANARRKKAPPQDPNQKTMSFQ